MYRFVIPSKSCWKVFFSIRSVSWIKIIAWIILSCIQYKNLSLFRVQTSHIYVDEFVGSMFFGSQNCPGSRGRNVVGSKFYFVKKKKNSTSVWIYVRGEINAYARITYKSHEHRFPQTIMIPQYIVAMSTQVFYC